MELWDLYDRQRQLIGNDHIRGERIPNGCYHLVVHVWIRNNNDEYLISQRSTNCSRFPLMWECVGGSVLKGEDSLAGALREVKEEVGITLSPESGRLLSSEVRECFQDIRDIWLFEYAGSVRLEKATTDEVAQVKWLQKCQIKELFDAELIVDDLQYFFHKVDPVKLEKYPSGEGAPLLRE